MQIQYAILLPPTALALLTGVVFVRLYKDRIAEIRARRIHPQQLATAEAGARDTAERDRVGPLPQSVRSAGAVLRAVRLISRSLSSRRCCCWPVPGAMWCCEPCTRYIHLTNNKVMRRFQLYFASTIVLYVMWACSRCACSLHEADLHFFLRQQAHRHRRRLPDLAAIFLDRAVRGELAAARAVENRHARPTIDVA